MATMTHAIRTADRARHKSLEGLLSQQDSVLRNRMQILRDSQASGVMDIEEHALDAEELGVGFSLLELTSQTVQAIERALQRLEAGQFGTCSDCRRRISGARLRALPFAALCLDCRDRHDKAAVPVASLSRP
jgi:DnaK suppressor protein